MAETQVRVDFFKNIETLAKSLLEKHGLKDWHFGWDRAKRRYGLCNFERKRISLSFYLTPLCSHDEIQNTILHEIAHALVGPKHGHDEIWRKKAVEIGCDGKRCGHGVNLPKSFVGSCPSCGTKIFRNKRTQGSCGICDKKFNPKFLIVWQRIN